MSLGCIMVWLVSCRRALALCRFKKGSGSRCVPSLPHYGRRIQKHSEAMDPASG